MSREDIRIASHGEMLGAWLYKGRRGAPCIVMAHGIGGWKEMRLDAYAEKFNDAGYWCIVFDYRCFGNSTGKPRLLVDIKQQHEDWHAAIKYARSELPNIDSSRIALFGSSFSGGHVLEVAAKDGKIAAVVSQAGFMSGRASMLTASPFNLPWVLYRALKDRFFSSRDQAVTINVVGTPKEVALITENDDTAFRKLLPAKSVIPEHEVNLVSARTALYIPFYTPGAQAKNVKCPILFAVCDKDTATPPEAGVRYAAEAPKATVKHYDVGHFDIYTGETFEIASKDYVTFYKQHIPI